MHLVLNNISKTFVTKDVLKDFNLEVEKGEIISLLGPSGCGKTTILKIIGGFLTPSSGSIILNGKDIRNLPPEKREVSTVFQSYALFPHMKVIDNVIYGLKFKGYSKKDAIKEGEKYLEIIGLLDNKSSFPSTLSGGEKQRVALARSLILNPKVLLLDEALSSLDTKLRVKMRSEIKKIGKMFNTTMIFVTHDQEEALSISDKIAVMYNGKIQQIASPEEIYEKPSNDFVREFIGDCSDFTLHNKKIRLRPENITLLSLDENYEEEDVDNIGLITNVEFLGFYIQYEVMIYKTKERIIVKTFNKKKPYLLGERVRIIT